MYEKNLTCLHCGKTYELTRMFEGCPSCTTGKFSSNVHVDYDYERIKESISRKILEQRNGPGIFKYEELLPISSQEGITTLGEGATPLLPCPKLKEFLDVHHLYVKDESRNPSHTFKDRSAAVAVSVARRFGSRHIIAGGGNTASAASAYGARYGFEVISFENVEESKQAILQTLSYGGKIVYLQKYEDRYPLMKTCVDTLGAHPVSSYTWAPTGDPYSEEGRKTIAFEICEQLGWGVPDKVIVPTGMGFGLFAIWRGFQDLYTIGLTDSLPQMVAVESSAGGSLTKTFQNHSETIVRVKPQETVALHILVPQVGYQAYRAVKDSHGIALTVEDEEIMEALFSLARNEGVYASTTSASALAAAKNLREQDYIDSDELVVCIITGGGLKDPQFVEPRFGNLPSPIPGDWSTFTHLMKDHYNVSL
jgi:threonine synthase